MTDHICLKCGQINTLPDDHKLVVCGQCGAVQDKVRDALARKPPRDPNPKKMFEPPPTPLPPPEPAAAAQLLPCTVCKHSIASTASHCPHCGAPNSSAPPPAPTKPIQFLGAIAIAAACFGLITPYFAAVFIVPIACILALIAIAKQEAIAGIVALAISAFAFAGIYETSQKISRAQAELNRIADDARRARDKIERDLQDIQRKYGR